MRVEEFVAFIAERIRIRQKKDAGASKPWTQDRILQMYRFCNAEREYDTETVWIAKNWRYPYQEHKHLWFLMLVARFLNWHPTLEEIDPKKVLGLDVAHILRQLRSRAYRGHKVFTGAYTVSTNGRSMNKVDYVCGHVFEPAADMARACGSLYESHSAGLWGVHRQLMDLPGISDFMSGQIIADLKYAAPYHEAHDWDSFAVAGPGSKRGMNRVCDRPVDKTWPGTEWPAAMRKLRSLIEQPLASAVGDRGFTLHAQDVQNCLCEFDKYERVRLGEGRPRSAYPGRF